MKVPQPRPPPSGCHGPTGLDAPGAPSSLPPGSAQRCADQHIYATPLGLNTLKRGLSQSPGGDKRPSSYKQQRTENNSCSPVFQPLHNRLQTPASAAGHRNECSMSDANQGCQKSDPLSYTSDNTRPYFDSANVCDDLFDDPEIEQYLEQLDETGIMTLTQCTPCQDDSGDVFDPDEFDEDTLTEPLNGFTSQDAKPFPPIIPPSSVVKAHDRNSRSADEFDLKLQHSSPCTGSSVVLTSRDESPLEQDVDWTPILERVQKVHTAHSRRDRRETETVRSTGSLANKGIVTATNSFPLTIPLTPPKMLLRPYKTFFHIQEMLDAKLEMYRNQPEAIFELFARVVRSSRENFYRRQHFQFRSVFSEAPPSINGVLAG